MDAWKLGVKGKAHIMSWKPLMGVDQLVFMACLHGGAGI